MGKTERILSYLPPTFRPYPRPSLLYSVVDAVGQRLLEADNLLFEAMRGHWVDFADQGASAIRDLAKLAALYDLQPRDDEDVETFRTHLKNYVRTYLRGSATVRGVLRLRQGKAKSVAQPSAGHSESPKVPSMVMVLVGTDRT